MSPRDPPAPGQFTFVKKEDRGDEADGANVNAALRHAGKALRSEIAQSDGQLASDFEAVLRGEAIYLPHFHCAARDYALLASLAKDLEEHEAAPGTDDADAAGAGAGGMVNWSKHLKHENPTFSATFQSVVDAMAAHFDVDVYATRLNFYRDGTDWKPFHHDSHAFGGREKREDFTMGASFGGERELEFLHEPSGGTFTFPQKNGDVFAFTTEVNKRFKHGVPKLTRGIGGPRFSIIAWGRRRSLNARNGGGAGGEVREEGEARAGSSGRGNAATTAPAPAATARAMEKTNELVMGSGEVSELIRSFLAEESAKASTRGGKPGGARRIPPPPPTPTPTRAVSKPKKSTKPPPPPTAGSAALASDLRRTLGEDAYLALRDLARAFQRGETTAAAFYDAAVAVDVDVVLRLAAHLPDARKRAELLEAHAARIS